MHFPLQYNREYIVWYSYPSVHQIELRLLAMLTMRRITTRHPHRTVSYDSPLLIVCNRIRENREVCNVKYNISQHTLRVPAHQIPSHALPSLSKMGSTQQNLFSYWFYTAKPEWSIWVESRVWDPVSQSSVLNFTSCRILAVWPNHTYAWSVVPEHICWCDPSILPSLWL